MFSHCADLEVGSAGTNNDAEIPLSGELIEWADVIVVMGKQHRAKLQKRFRSSLHGKRVVCLDIPDYEFMDPALVSFLQARLARYLGRNDVRQMLPSGRGSPTTRWWDG